MNILKIQALSPFTHFPQAKEKKDGLVLWCFFFDSFFGHAKKEHNEFKGFEIM